MLLNHLSILLYQFLRSLWRNFNNMLLSLQSIKVSVGFSWGFNSAFQSGFSNSTGSLQLWSLSCSIWPWGEFVGTSAGSSPVLAVISLTVTAEWRRALKCWVLIISPNWPLMPKQYGEIILSVNGLPQMFVWKKKHQCNIQYIQFYKLVVSPSLFSFK